METATLSSFYVNEIALGRNTHLWKHSLGETFYQVGLYFKTHFKKIIDTIFCSTLFPQKILNILGIWDYTSQ